MSYSLQFRFKLMIISVLCAGILCSHAEQMVLMNRPLSEDDCRYDYPKELLQRVLAVTEKKYGKASVGHSKFVMTRERVFHSLLKGKDIHVMAEAPKPNWEEKLLVVRVPIRKGIQGLRIFLSTKEHSKLLETVNSLEDLRKIPTGSGQQWSTTRVLRHHKFNVVEGNNYEGLFKMMMSGRFSTFNRGLNEVYVEYEARKEAYPKLIVDEKLLLYIPLPTYFFVSPKQPVLAKRIEEGLLILIKNGEFEKVFQKHFGVLLKSLNLKERKVFKVTNPNLSKLTPFHVKEFWYLQESDFLK